jgi:hypothetical protein
LNQFAEAHGAVKLNSSGQTYPQTKTEKTTWGTASMLQLVDGRRTRMFIGITGMSHKAMQNVQRRSER